MSLDDRWQIADLKARVPLAELMSRDLLFKRKANRLVACCPFHAERTPSFGISRNGLFYKCFGCGAKGDQFGWLMDYHKMDFRQAKAELMRLAGIAPDEWERADPEEMRRKQAAREQEAEAEAARVRQFKMGCARDIWDSAKPAAGTLAEVYLRQRGVGLSVVGYPPTLRFHGALLESGTGLCHPALVAYMQGPDGAFVGVHRTYLAADGKSKLKAFSRRDGERVAAKQMLGAAWQGAVRLAKGAKVMAVGEGIETCLSALSARPGLAVWAALSLGNIAGGGLGKGAPHPTREGHCLPSITPDPAKPGLVLPEVARKVLLLADNDNKDPEMAECILQRAANRWRGEGREVLLAMPPVGMDFNDWWRAQAAQGGKK